MSTRQPIVAAGCLSFGLTLVLASCGYVAGPMPPLANVPAPVRDLAAIQRGDKIIVQFTIPTVTTENVTIKEPLSLDLRIGLGVNPFSPARWAAQATHIPANGNTKASAYYEIPATPWVGKTVTLGERSIGANGKDSDWSNFAVFEVVASPEQPQDLHGESTPTGIRLTWRARGGHFHVVRKTVAEPNAVPVTADVTQPEFLDTTAAIGTEYSYVVLTFVPLGDNKEAQSELSVELKISRQAPPPAKPTGLLAVPAPRSVELSWDSNPGPETVGYRVYRLAAGADFVKVGEVSAVPTYSDTTVEHGKTYRYTVAAIDKDGRESPRSDPVEVIFP